MTAYQRPIVLSGEIFHATSSTASAWSVLKPWQQGMFIVLSIAILCSALSVVLVQHAHRQQMRELHAGMNLQDELNHAWSQLLVEQSAWAAMDHVETAARQNLGMVIPDLSQVTYLTVDRVTQGRRVAQDGSLKPMQFGVTDDWLRHPQTAQIPILARQKSTAEGTWPES